MDTALNMVAIVVMANLVFWAIAPLVLTGRQIDKALDVYQGRWNRKTHGTLSPSDKETKFQRWQRIEDEKNEKIAIASEYPKGFRGDVDECS